MLACLNGNEKAIELLIQSGCQLNVVESDGWNAINVASHNGHKNNIDILVKKKGVLVAQEIC